MTKKTTRKTTASAKKKIAQTIKQKYSGRGRPINSGRVYPYHELEVGYGLEYDISEDSPKEALALRNSISATAHYYMKKNPGVKLTTSMTKGEKIEVDRVA